VCHLHLQTKQINQTPYNEEWLDLVINKLIKRRMTMKKFVIGLVVGLSLMFSFQVFAEDGLTKIEAYLRPGLIVTLDNQRVNFESPPVMVDGNTYLKLRDVAALTDLHVNWIEATQTVELVTDAVYGTLPQSPPPTTSVVPPSSDSGTVEANSSTGGANMIFTNVELTPVTKDGIDYYSIRSIAAQHYSAGYDIHYDASKNELFLIKYTKAHDKNVFEILSPAIPTTAIDGDSYTTVDEYENVIFPLIN
jgi:hypothetical protein